MLFFDNLCVKQYLIFVDEKVFEKIQVLERTCLKKKKKKKRIFFSFNYVHFNIYVISFHAVFLALCTFMVCYLCYFNSI